MNRLQKRRLQFEIDRAHQEALDEITHRRVEMGLVRSVAKRSRGFFVKGGCMTFAVRDVTAKFMKVHLEKVFTHYWGMPSNSFAIYTYPAREDNEYSGRCQIVFVNPTEEEKPVPQKPTMPPPPPPPPGVRKIRDGRPVPRQRRRHE